jgi:dolichol-phosphate mannosyltransferase
MGKSNSVVVIPTYNEAENLDRLLPQLLDLDLEILVVDDNSQDGTVEIIKKWNEKSGCISILERPSKLGLGSAYKEGFALCLSRNYEKIIQMDADGSHRVEDLQELLKIDADLVIGSRWVTGGSIENWSKHRELLSRLANHYSKAMLRTPIHDMTAGFRIYRCSLLRKMDLASIQSQGYSFQIEMTLEALDKGGKILEAPISFIERTSGKSKMSSAIVREAMIKVTKWGFSRRLHS